jgi:hypothetical protein
MLESAFKTGLIQDLKDLFPGCIIAHLDPNETQGLPDLLILFEDKWATLEGKRHRISPPAESGLLCRVDE